MALTYMIECDAEEMAAIIDRRFATHKYRVPLMEAAAKAVGFRFEKHERDNVMLLWLPDTKRAALNAIQGTGDWTWTDAASVDDAFRRYAEDDLAN